MTVQCFQHRVFVKKNDGGVRGMVVGDGWWPAIAQQFTQEAEAVTHPFQCVLSTRAGTECGAESDEHGQQCHHFVHQSGHTISSRGKPVWQFFPTVTNLSHSSGIFSRGAFYFRVGGQVGGSAHDPPR